jgi:hypothetical protein
MRHGCCDYEVHGADRRQELSASSTAYADAARGSTQGNVQAIPRHFQSQHRDVGSLQVV